MTSLRLGLLALLLLSGNKPLSWDTLLSHRAEYHGKVVTLEGYYRKGFELSGLFESMKTCEKRGTPAIWINEMPDAIRYKAANSCIHVRVEGSYDSKQGGHLGGYDGVIRVKSAEIAGGESK